MVSCTSHVPIFATKMHVENRNEPQKMNSGKKKHVFSGLFTHFLGWLQRFSGHLSSQWGSFCRFSVWWFGTMEFSDFPYIGNSNPKWWTPSFFRGVGWNHQAVLVVGDISVASLFLYPGSPFELNDPAVRARIERLGSKGQTRMVGQNCGFSSYLLYLVI